MSAVAAASIERWDRVRNRLREWSACEDLFRYGQRDSLLWIAEHIRLNGVIIADEVGLGKTRLALLAMMAVLEEGGNVVAVVPPGLLFQWQQEAESLALAMSRHFADGRARSWSACMIRSYDDLFKVLEEKDRYPLANQKAGRWVLISQRFDLYKIKGNARAWRLEVPALVRAHQELNKEGHSNNDRWIQYWRKGGFNTLSFAENSWRFNENKAAEFLSKRSFSKEMLAILEDERIRPNRGDDQIANDACAAFFRQGNDGRKLLMHLVGKLIGPIDLLVMDEAHKSREDGDIPQKQLGRLLEEILQPAAEHRRISLTATPIELSPQQWSSLLRRTGIGKEHPSWDSVQHAIERFSIALFRAQTRPDQSHVLDELLSASATFEKALQPFVTRRRRLHQTEMQALLPEGLPGAHPHRKLASCSIEIHHLEDNWRKMVLALEGQGLASKGLGALGLAQRQSDIRYSSGLNCEFELAPPEEGTQVERKERRMRAWAGLQRRLAAHLSGSGKQWLWSHPRILHAADRIEALCQFDGPNPREKVLVFGRYSDAMKALRDTLNARHILRIIDLAEVAFVPRLSNAETEPLLAYVYGELHREGRFTGRLKTQRPDRTSLLELERQAHSRYEDAREALRDRFSDDLDDWIAAQPGDSALRRLRTEASSIYSDVIKLLRSDVFDTLLYQRRDPRQVSQPEIENLAHKAWISHLACLVHGDEEPLGDEVSAEDSNSKRTPNVMPTGELSLLDAKGDLLHPERFAQYLNLDPRSALCRILDGSVDPKARRSVQTSFNRRETTPYVLVAQSVVGREGLNLHKACRRVFIFHPEWNPGVLEQQIGRVDRIESLWTQLAQEWGEASALGSSPREDFPRIEVESLVFRGTYDEYQSSILQRRRASLNAQLFGALLDEEALPRVPEEYRERLAKGAPDWGPKNI